MITARLLASGVALWCLAVSGCGSQHPAATATSPAGAGASPASPGGGTVISTPGGGSPTTSAAVEANPPGDIPDNQVFVSFVPASGGYSVKVPEGWARVDAGSASTFTDHYNSVRVETVAAASAPTVASAQSSEVPAIRSRHPDLSDLQVTTVTRVVGGGVLITYKAYSAPDPVTGKVARLDVQRYEFWRGGTEAILTLSGPTGADNVDPWRTVTDGFRWQ